jgi:hypothetical protein
MDDAGFTSQNPLYSRLTVPVEFVVGKVGVEPTGKRRLGRPRGRCVGSKYVLILRVKSAS